MEKFWGFFGDGDGFDFEFFWGSIPENPQKTGMGTGIEPLKGLGILWGQERLNLWGFFGGKSPKNLKKRGGDGGRILRDFAHLFHSKCVYYFDYLDKQEIFRDLLPWNKQVFK